MKEGKKGGRKRREGERKYRLHVMGKGGKNIRSKTFRIINVLRLFGHLLLTSYNPDNNFKTKLWINLELKVLD